MDDADRGEALFVSFGQVSFDDRPDVFWAKRMQVERIGYLDLDWFGEWIFQIIHDRLFMFDLSLLILRDVLGRRHAHTVLVFEYNKRLVVHLPRRAAKTNGEGLVVAFALNL